MKKYKYIIIGIILICIMAIVVAFLVDQYRMRNDLPVIFSTWGYDYAPPVVDIDNNEEVNKDNAVILMHGEIKNIERLNEFIANTNAFAKKRINDSVRLVSYTIEGDEIITDLEYIENEGYELTIDNTRDEFAGIDNRKITQTKYSSALYDIKKIEDGNYIHVKLVKNELSLYQYTSDFKDIFICSYLKEAGKESEENKSFFGKVIESEASYIIVEPNEDEVERKSSDKFRINLGENNDALYMVGTNVKITYSGNIMETHPAQINAINIEIKSADDFELIFKQRYDLEIKTIVEKNEIDNLIYSVYSYGGDVFIKINGKEFELREALLNNKITIDEIIKKANTDLNAGKITGDMYKDGGTKIYKYDEYTILKYNTLNGKNDVFIGNVGMTYEVYEYEK